MAKTRGRHSSQPQLPSRSFTFILNEGDRRVTPQISLQLHQTLHALVVVSFQGPGATFLEIFGTEPCAIPCANLRPQGLKPLIDSSIVACGTEVAIVQHHLGAQLDRIVGPPQLRMPHQEVLGQEIKRCSSWKQNETNNMGSELVKTIYMCVCVCTIRQELEQTTCLVLGFHRFQTPMLHFRFRECQRLDVQERHDHLVRLTMGLLGRSPQKSLHLLRYP